MIAGEPGIGKTRLAEQFAASGLAQGATVLMGRCSEEPLAPFEPYTEALAQAGAPMRSRPLRALTTEARATVCSTRSTPPWPTVSTRAPLLLVIDDFHWADRGSLLLTSFLLRSSRPGPILVLGTYRNTELGRHTPLTAALGEFKRGGALDRIDLRGLAPWTTWQHSPARCWAPTTTLPRVHARTAATRSLSRRC